MTVSQTRVHHHVVAHFTQLSVWEAPEDLWWSRVFPESGRSSVYSRTKKVTLVSGGNQYDSDATINSSNKID